MASSSSVQGQALQSVPAVIETPGICVLCDFLIFTGAAKRPTIDHCPRILSLDGGGVRGLSSLLILREIMEEIQRQSGSQDTPLPCEYLILLAGRVPVG